MKSSRHFILWIVTNTHFLLKFFDQIMAENILIMIFLNSSRNIFHETTCPHTPQQNGIAKRKNLHILKTTRTLLIGACTPRVYWRDVVINAVYLMNRMPSQFLSFWTYLAMPTDHVTLPSTLHLEPRVFGCVAYVHLCHPLIDQVGLPWPLLYTRGGSKKPKIKKKNIESKQKNLNRTKTGWFSFSFRGLETKQGWTEPIYIIK